MVLEAKLRVSPDLKGYTNKKNNPILSQRAKSYMIKTIFFSNIVYMILSLDPNKYLNLEPHQGSPRGRPTFSQRVPKAPLGNTIVGESWAPSNQA